MKRRRLLALSLLFLPIALTLRVAFWRPLEVVGEPPRDGYTRVSGVVHVHTSLSDGGGSPAEVIDAARRAGLGFVAITDHNNLDAKPFEGYREGVLVLVAPSSPPPRGTSSASELGTRSSASTAMPATGS